MLERWTEKLGERLK